MLEIYFSLQEKQPINGHKGKTTEKKLLYFQDFLCPCKDKWFGKKQTGVELLAKRMQSKVC